MPASMERRVPGWTKLNDWVKAFYIPEEKELLAWVQTHQVRMQEVVRNAV